jgi:A/G-specific adenine glycosylase
LLDARDKLADPFFRRRLQRRLVSWFVRHGRGLVWRRDRDPYRIWVSEVMLQQTQVATVIPYFQRFLQAFPTLSALAHAQLSEVLKHWEGLGYYRRARNLHEAARILHHFHQGQIPNDPLVLQELPGIGRYILGAVLSQAYDRRLPIVEANSERVLCRLLAVREDPRSGSTRKWLWQAAATLLPLKGVGDFNQALMELGALVCTSTTPHCQACPVAECCGARQEGIQDQIPTRATALPALLIDEVGIVVRRRQRVLLVQRPDDGRWGSMWEFPHGTVSDRENHEMAALRLVRQSTGLEVRLGSELLTLRHTVTRHRITLVCYEADYRAGSFASTFYRRGIWLNLSQLSGYPISTPQRRIARALTGERQRRFF